MLQYNIIGYVFREYKVTNVTEKQEQICKFLGSQDGYSEDYRLLECDTM
jgi:hypothetical protein